MTPQIARGRGAALALGLVVVLIALVLAAVALAPPAGARTPQDARDPAAGATPRHPASVRSPVVPRQAACDVIDGLIPDLPLPGPGDACRVAGDAAGAVADFGESVLDFLETTSCIIDGLPTPVKVLAFSALPVPFSGAAGLIEIPWCEPEVRERQQPCAARTDYEEDEQRGPNLGGLLPDRCWGTYPSEYYDFNYDEGGMLALDRKLIGTLTGLAYSAGKGLTQVGLWLVEWGYAWDADRRLGGLAEDLSLRFDRGLVQPLALKSLAWFLLIAWAGFTMLRGRLSVAVSEVALSMLLAAVAVFFTAHATGYRTGAFETLNQLSDTVLAVGTDGEVPDGAGTRGDVLDAHLRNLHIAFVEQPYDHLNWGGELGGYDRDGTGPQPPPDDNIESCAEARNDIVARGPHGAAGYPRTKMGERAECQSLAAFNSQLHWDKVFAAFLYLTGALIMFLLLGTVSLTIILAKLGLILMFGIAPFAVVLAVLPGGGRRTAWRWLSSLLSMLVLVVAMSFILAVLVVAVDELLSIGGEEALPGGAPGGIGMLERFLLLDLMVVCAVIARKRLLAGGQALAARLGDRVAATSPALNRGGWSGGGGGGGSAGAPLGAGDSDVPEALAAGIVIGAAVRQPQRLHERRARRVDSTRGNRRHGLFMMANGLTKREPGWRAPSMSDRVRNRLGQQIESSSSARFVRAFLDPSHLNRYRDTEQKTRPKATGLRRLSPRNLLGSYRARETFSQAPPGVRIGWAERGYARAGSGARALGRTLLRRPEDN